MTYFILNGIILFKLFIYYFKQIRFSSPVLHNPVLFAFRCDSVTNSQHCMVDIILVAVGIIVHTQKWVLDIAKVKLLVLLVTFILKISAKQHKSDNIDVYVKYRFCSTGRWTAWHLYPLTQVPPLPQQQSVPSHYPQESLYTLYNWLLSLNCCRHIADPEGGSSEMNKIMTVNR